LTGWSRRFQRDRGFRLLFSATLFPVTPSSLVWRGEYEELVLLPELDMEAGYARLAQVLRQGSTSCTVVRRRRHELRDVDIESTGKPGDYSMICFGGGVEPACPTLLRPALAHLRPLGARSSGRQRFTREQTLAFPEPEGSCTFGGAQTSTCRPAMFISTTTVSIAVHQLVFHHFTGPTPSGTVTNLGSSTRDWFGHVQNFKHLRRPHTTTGGHAKGTRGLLA